MTDPGADDLVVVGPAPPRRGGIAAHSARLVEHLRGRGGAARACSYRRLYPAALFPGREQYGAGPRPPWCDEALVAWSPASGRRAGTQLQRGAATVVVQWWHPVTAPALWGLLGCLPAERVVAVCHNALPHENFPGAARLARAVLARCGRVLCHSASEAARVRALLGDAAEIVVAALPPLVSAADLEASTGTRPAALTQRGPVAGPVVVAAGHVRAYKGTAVLVEAWKAARRPAGARLALVGESYLGGAAQRRLQRSINEDPSILVVNQYVDDVELVSWLTSAHAIVTPYLTASQSGMLALASALEVPAIVSEAGGLPEQARPGDLVVAAGDVAALALALEQRLREPDPVHPLASGARVARALQVASLSWQRVVEAIGVATRPSAA